MIEKILGGIFFVFARDIHHSIDHGKWVTNGLVVRDIVRNSLWRTNTSNDRNKGRLFR